MNADTSIPGHAEDELGDPESVARLLCLRQLETRARTRSELAGHLERKGIAAEPAQRVLDRFGELGLIDDQALASSFVVARHGDQGLARRALVDKLRQRGVEAPVIDQAVAQIDSVDELERARRLVARKGPSMSALDPRTQARRLIGLLARKGYPAGLSYEVVREYLADREIDDLGPELDG